MIIPFMNYLLPILAFLKLNTYAEGRNVSIAEMKEYKVLEINVWNAK